MPTSVSGKHAGGAWSAVPSPYGPVYGSALERTPAAPVPCALLMLPEWCEYVPAAFRNAA
jgi:hypothetical protein